jgi:E3 ubiquitin-protein ligase MARCH6
MDMEINLALDELLGFRGPLLAVLRNLLWLLVFNTAYLGVFALLPSSFGASIFTLSSKLSALHTIIDALPGSETVINILVALNEKSKETNLIFQPSDIGQIFLGYSTFACFVFFVQMVAIITVSKRAYTRGQPNGVDEELEAGRRKIISLINCSAAIVKVVVLLFIKMLVLPLSLGLCLDVATLPLFKKTLDDRISFTGTDLFGSLFLHWVTGITFMLLVTVSVLQLREVAHPDILARVIRPQEPQPDLLGNLLQETAVTHTKRILLSLGIYAALLSIHIWLPSRILMAYNLYEQLPFFNPKYWHIFMPQIQIPAELFLFHLCMLSVLEKYKNNIGGLQHHWLHVFGNLLGITDQILPKEVDKFVYVGAIPVFAHDTLLDLAIFNDEEQMKFKTGIPPNVLDPFWNELISESDPLKRESIIQSRLRGVDQPFYPVFEEGEVRRDGKKVLSSNAFIRFPISSSEEIKRAMKSLNDTRSLLPTCIGRYRLKQRITRISTPSSDCNDRMPKVNSDISNISC